MGKHGPQALAAENQARATLTQGVPPGPAEAEATELLPGTLTDPGEN